MTYRLRKLAAGNYEDVRASACERAATPIEAHMSEMQVGEIVLVLARGATLAHHPDLLAPPEGAGASVPRRAWGPSATRPRSAAKAAFRGPLVPRRQVIVRIGYR